MRVCGRRNAAQLPVEGNIYDRPALAECFREMALEDLVHALSRRLRKHGEAGEEAAAAEVEGQLEALISKYPEALRRCAAGMMA